MMEVDVAVFTVKFDALMVLRCGHMGQGNEINWLPTAFSSQFPRVFYEYFPFITLPGGCEYQYIMMRCL